MSEEIIIKYKKDKKLIRLFGKEFVNNNKDICKIIINDIEEELKEFHILLKYKTVKKRKRAKMIKRLKKEILQYQILESFIKKQKD